MESSCACTSTGFAVGTVFQPGQSIRVKASLDTSGYEGVIVQQVTLFTDRDGRQVMLPLQVKVKRELILENEPYEIISRKGEKKVWTITARWLTPGQAEITQVEGQGGYVSAELIASKPRVEYQILIKPITTHTTDSWNEVLLIHTSLPGLPIRQVEFTGRVQGSVEITPSPWVAGRFFLGQGKYDKLSQTFILKSAGAAFTIKKVSGEVLPGFQATSQRISASEWSLAVSFDPGALARKAKPKSIFQGKIQVWTDLPDESPLRIPVFLIFEPEISS